MDSSQSQHLSVSIERFPRSFSDIKDLENKPETSGNESGPVKVVDKGPRNIDLDILLYDDQVVNHPRLKVPHPLMREREFVLRPLAELIPGKSLDSKNPRKVTQDYLNELPSSESVMTAITLLTKFMEPLHGLDPRRRTRIMAILNATPDSFSDGGRVPAESASKAIYDFKTDVWSTIIDVGGQSTAPGVKEDSADEETKRVVTTIEEITNAFGELSISVDTYRASSPP
ncbi:Dihydropteroate synthase-like protein [Hyaloscypha finlandica]|nr:Dihydropteroate synthase-like protein [Hyaloscypha finlandica]